MPSYLDGGEGENSWEEFDYLNWMFSWFQSFFPQKLQKKFEHETYEVLIVL